MGGRTPPITNRSGFLVAAAPPPSEMGASPHTPVYSCSSFAFRRFEVSRFAPSGRPRSGLTLTRDHSPTLPRKGQGSPLPLCLAASVKTGVKGDEVPLVGGVKGRAKPTPCKRGLRLAIPILAKNNLASYNDGGWFAFFVPRRARIV